MYIGSVRFYKHLILSTMALAVIVPTSLSVYFGVNYIKTKNQLDLYEQHICIENSLRENNVSSEYQKFNQDYSFDYQDKYPDMYVERNDFIAEQDEKPVVYLTFDDGPSLNTATVLDILKANDIKATFFVVNNNISAQQYLYKRIVDEGHTIGVHTYTHRYNTIYSSVDEYLDDFYNMFSKVYELTGVKPTVFRFPGGSINTYNRHIYEEIISEMLRRGFTYYDWNVSSGDAGLTYSSEAIRNAVVTGVGSKKKSIVLMHDSSTKNATAFALQNIINDLKETHVFKPITNSVKPTVFTYKND